MPDPRPPSPGEQVGAWTLRVPIARGGMGEVWRAEPTDGDSGPDAAVKFIAPERLGADTDGDARARFAREVAATRRVESPHVAEVLDADTEGERPWVASRYVDGPTLAARVGADGPLPESELRTLGWDLAAGLAAVHAAGVVHRDLTPGNVVLGPSGPVIVDFGISRVEGVATITQAGSMVGTPAWMAPEQLRDDEVSDATDVWALGAVLAYAATGRPVVDGSRTEVVMAKVLEGDVDLDGLPEWMVPVVTAALSLEPSHRPTADEVPALMRETSARGPDAVTAVIPPEPVTGSSPPPEGLAATAATGPDASGDGGDRPDPGRRSRLWIRVVGAAAGFALGSLIPPLGAVIVFALCALGAGGLRIWNQERGGGRPSLVSPSAVGLVGTVALVTSLSTVIGVVLAVLVVVVVVLVFVILGGDVM